MPEASVTQTPDAKLLRIYLQDHHAGSVVGVNLARRIAGQNEDNEYGAELARIAQDIEADQDALERILEALDHSTDRVKDLGAWAGEKVGRLKRNGRWFDYSPLSRLLELEGLMLGVNGKLALWRAVRRAHGDKLGGEDIAELEARAVAQRDSLEVLRLDAAGEALTSD